MCTGFLDMFYPMNRLIVNVSMMIMSYVLPSRKVTYPTFGKEQSSTQNNPEWYFSTAHTNTTTVDGSEIPNNHRLDVWNPEILGIFTISTGDFTGYLNHLTVGIFHHRGGAWKSSPHKVDAFKSSYQETFFVKWLRFRFLLDVFCLDFIYIYLHI